MWYEYVGGLGVLLLIGVITFGTPIFVVWMFGRAFGYW